ncbi:MAG TPA: hypothetical protein DEB39_00830 [Planctomycetaceae bacterium]|nr:hypothetical protein [Planctomycetaceae bacterium]
MLRFALNVVGLLVLLGPGNDCLSSEDLFKQPKMAEAEKRFDEAVDKAKRRYQDELEKEWASAKRRGDLKAYDEIEAEIAHTKGGNGHDTTPYVPRTKNLRNSKQILVHNVRTAKSRYTTALKNYSSELLRQGDVENARLLNRIAEAGDPAKSKMLVEIVISPEEIEFKEQYADIPMKNVLTDDWEKRVPQATKVRELKWPNVHQSAYGATWSADGESIATFGYAHFARLIDVKTWTMVSEIPKQGDSRGTGVVFLNKHNLILFGGCEGEVGLWNLRKWSKTWFDKENGWTGAIAVSLDEKTVCASAGNVVYVRDADKGEVIAKLDYHTKRINGAAFFLRGLRLVTVSEDGTAVIWDTATWKPIRLLRGHSENVTSVSVSPDDRWIATGSTDDRVIVWQARTGEPVMKIGNFQGDIISVLFSPDGKKLAVGKNYRGDHTFIVDTETWNAVAYCQGHGMWNSQMGWSPDSRRIVTCGDEAMVFELPEN